VLNPSKINRPFAPAPAPAPFNSTRVAPPVFPLMLTGLAIVGSALVRLIVGVPAPRLKTMLSPPPPGVPLTCAASPAPTARALLRVGLASRSVSGLSLVLSMSAGLLTVSVAPFTGAVAGAPFALADTLRAPRPIECQAPKPASNPTARAINFVFQLRFRVRFI